MAKKPTAQGTPGGAAGDETNPFKANSPGPVETGATQASDDDTE
jgi:hypothetical protein